MKLINLTDTPLEPVSHDPQILKQVMVDRGVVPKLTKFSKAVIRSGQVASAHSHENMYEIFFFLAGKGKLLVSDRTIDILPNLCIVVEPGERHAIAEVTADIELLYFGIEI